MSLLVLDVVVVLRHGHGAQVPLNILVGWVNIEIHRVVLDRVAHPKVANERWHIDSFEPLLRNVSNALVTLLGIYAKDDDIVLGVVLKTRERNIVDIATIDNLGHILLEGFTLLVSLRGYPHRDVLNQKFITGKLLNLSLFIDYT